MHRCGFVGRRIEVVAERGAERFFITFAHGERVHHRRPEIFVLDRKQLADGLCFGFQPLQLLLGGGERRAGGVDFLARACVRELGCLRGFLGVRQRALRGGERLVERGEIGRVAAAGGKAGFDVGDFGFQPRRALRVLLRRGLELIAAGGQIGQRAGQFGKGFFRCGECRVGLSRPGR